MKNRDGELIYNSLNTNGIRPFIGDGEWIDKIQKFESLKYVHLGPDLICIAEKEIYGIEHFYVDSSEIKKGSKLKSEYNKNIDKNIIHKIEKKLEKDNVSSNSYKFKSVLTYENLKNNTYSSFDNHYKKIKIYNQNIQEEYGTKKNIGIIFFIEYNILPSVYLIDGKPEKYCYPFNDINFLKYFSDKKEIRGIIFSVGSDNYYISIRDNYIIDNINIFDFSSGKIDDFKMNQITVGVNLNYKR